MKLILLLSKRGVSARRGRAAMVLLVGSLSFSGCATMQRPTNSYEDHRLEAIDGNERVLAWRAKTFDFSSFDRIVLDELTFASHSRVEALSAKDRGALTQAASQCLIGRFGKAIPVSKDVGKGALILRSEIIDIASPIVALNMVSTAVVGPLTNGGVSVEFQAIDAETGETLAVLRGSQTGNVIRNFGGSYTRLGHAKGAMDRLTEKWAAYLLSSNSVNLKKS